MHLNSESNLIRMWRLLAFMWSWSRLKLYHEILPTSLGSFVASLLWHIHKQLHCLLSRATITGSYKPKVYVYYQKLAPIDEPHSFCNHPYTLCSWIDLRSNFFACYGYVPTSYNSNCFKSQWLILWKSDGSQFQLHYFTCVVKFPYKIYSL